MDFSSLPPETQFQYLLSLPYEWVINYCQTNTIANSICQTPAFWQRKALSDFQAPLSLIPYFNPSIQYKILSDILSMNASDALKVASASGYVDLISYILTKDLGQNSLMSLKDAIDAAAANDHIDVIELLLSNLQSVDDITFRMIIRSALDSAIENEHLDVIKYLREYHQFTFGDELSLAVYYDKPKLFNEIINNEISQPGFAQKLNNFLFSYIIENDIKVVQWLVPHWSLYLNLNQALRLSRLLNNSNITYYLRSHGASTQGANQETLIPYLSNRFRQLNKDSDLNLLLQEAIVTGDNQTAIDIINNYSNRINIGKARTTAINNDNTDIYQYLSQE